MKREVGILKYLLQNNGFISIDYLSEKFLVSTRTIREDLKTIKQSLNSSGLKFIQDRNKGVLINKDNANDNDIYKVIKKLGNDEDFYTEEERVNIILNELLTAKEEITYDYLMTKTNTSKTTVIKDLRKCENWLGARDIKIVKKPRKGTKIEYEETVYRNVVLEYIESYLKEFDFQKIYNTFKNKEFLVFNLSDNNLITYFTKNINVGIINNFIKKYETEQQIKFSEDAFIKIFFYILISVKRVKNGYILNNFDSKDITLKETFNVEEWIDKNSKLLYQSAEANLNSTEMKYILCYMLSQNKRYLKKDKDINLYDEKKLVDEFIKTVQEFLCTDLIGDKTLFDNLLMHITSTIHRTLFNIKVKNPLKNEIKKMYPEIFKSCQIGSNYLEERLGKKLSEDEVSFLTMHIAASLEKIKRANNKLNLFKTIIVCSSGIGTSNMLKMRLINEFPNIMVEKTCSVEEFNDTNKEGIDLVISTTALSFGSKESIIYVSPLLSEKDILKIKKHISKLGIKNRDNYSFVVEDLMDIISENCIINDYQKLERQIQKYFIKEEKIINNNKHLLSEFATKEHVMLNADVKDFKEAILLSGELMNKSGCVDKNYGAKMLEAKEILGSNVVISEGLALPHAKSTGNVYKTCMTFITLKNPVEFGNKDYDPVSIVISLAATKSNKHFKALSELIKLIDQQDILDKLKSSKSYEEFMEVLTAFETEYIISE